MFAIQLENAIIACQQALIQNTGFAMACRTLGNLLQSMGWFREALLWHSRSIETTVQPAEVYAGFGALYAKQGKWEQSLQAYQQSLQHDPNYAEAHRSLAGIYAHLGQRQEEIAYRYRAVVLKPDWATPSNQLILGNALIQLDKIQEAIDCYQRAIQLRPDFYEAYYNLAVAQAHQQNWRSAIEAFQQVLKLNPRHAESHYGLGKLADQIEQPKTAAAYYWRAIQNQPDFAAAYFSLGETLLKLREWQKALPICYRAAQLNPDLSWAHHNLGYAFLKHEQWQAAFTALHRAIQLNPDFPWSYYHLGQILLHKKQWNRAIAAFLMALQLQTDLAAVYLRLGYALRRQAHSQGMKATIQAYRRSVPLKPHHRTPDFYLQIAARLFQFKQYAGAIIFYSLALLHRPQAPQTAAQVQPQLQQSITEYQRLELEIQQQRQEIRQYPHHHWIYSHLGNLLADQGDLETASKLHQNAVVMRGWQVAVDRNYQFSHDWFTHNIPTWETYLRPFIHYPRVHALEIGSYEGMSACWLLDHILTHPEAKLTCIDLYFQENFEHNIHQTGAAHKLIKRIGDSHRILKTLPAKSFDFIYIDGCHLADHVRQDAILSWRLLKPGGLLIFDDYQWIDPAHPGKETYRGVDAFLDIAKHHLAIVHQDYQMIIRKLKLPIQPIVKPEKTRYPAKSNSRSPVLAQF
ncbi:MAG: tetratricopeptide repeat protein [Elainella sp. Prado103]|nr:tetratricopeptide repeat protein [Elainella sp. Prado103]